MSKRNPQITIEGPAFISDAGIGFDGEHFFVRVNGLLVAKRGLREISDEMGDDEACERLRSWDCIEPGWSVVETNRPKRGGTGSLHFKYEPPGSDAVQ